jgi:MFS superfamily sulfate permease-like transporter
MGDPNKAVALAGMMAIVSGICFPSWPASSAWDSLQNYFPRRSVTDYMNGIALTVLISQIPKMLGFSIESSGPLRNILRIGEALSAGNANTASLLIGTGTLAVILLLKRYKRIPGILLAVVAATLGH